MDYPSQAEVLAGQIRAYNSAVAAGALTPFPVAAGLLSISAAFLYMMLPRTALFDSAGFRGSVLAGTIAFALWTAAHVTTRNNRLGYCFGIMTVWAVLNVLAFMVVSNAKATARRIVRIQDAKGPRYVWQSWPEHSLAQRADWAFDLVCNVRGIGWNWQTLDAPGLPDFVARDVGAGSLSRANKQPAVSPTGCRMYLDRAELLRDNLRLVMHAMVLGGAMMVPVAADPYFAGFLDAPASALESPLTRRWALYSAFSRRVLPGLMFWNGIRGCLALRTVLCAWMGPKVLGLRGEPWMQPDASGALANVLDRGVAGFWGGWWHQTFRYGFQQAARALQTLLGAREGTLWGRLVGVFGVFAASGVLHAAGAHMQTGATRPWAGTFAFFAVQSVAVLLEAAWRRVYGALGLQAVIPRRVGRALTLAWVVGWFLLTAPLLVDDMVHGGIFLFALPKLEPLGEQLVELGRGLQVLQ